MREIRDAIYKQIDELHWVATDVQTVWMRKVAEREINRVYNDGKNEEKTSYELRVEFTDCSFRVRWVHVQFVKRGSKTIRVTKAIATPESGRYKISQFKYADDWELEYIEQIEEALAPVRKKLKHLMKAHQSIVYACKVDNIKLETIPIRDRVETNKHSIQEFKEKLRG